MSDEIDRDGANITASRLLNDHHDIVPMSGFGDGIADNCELCGFAAGCLQIAGEDDQGHATQASSDEVRAWLNRRKRTIDITEELEPAEMADVLRHIARLLDEGYTSGYEPTWALEAIDG